MLSFALCLCDAFSNSPDFSIEHLPASYANSIQRLFTSLLPAVNAGHQILLPWLVGGPARQLRL